MLTVPSGGSPYLRMSQGRRPTVSTVNDCRHRGKKDGHGVSPRRRQEHKGEDTPSEPKSSGGDDEEELEDGEEREVTPPPHFPAHEDLPHLVTSLASKQGSPDL
jgi:hypothetical protein